MNVLTKLRLIGHVAHWRLTWTRRDTRKAYLVAGNPKFMGARDAVGLIHDGDTVAVSGLAGNQRASIIYWAMRELFEETGSPRDLTVMAVGGFGGRGRVPGTVEELGLGGLVSRFFTGHTETFKSLLKLADEGRLELQCLPQGLMTFLLDGQSRGEDSLLIRTGVGTFMDPRVGRGSPVDNESAEQWVSVEGDKLRYRMPKVNVAVFNAPAADREGNIYAKNCAMLAETCEIAKAAKKNGGVVIANVGLVVDKGYGDIVLPADTIDAAVMFSGTEQVGSVPHRKYWPMFTTHSNVPTSEALAQVAFINRFLGFTPRRTDADAALARLAASLFVKQVFKGAFVNIGVGLPEEVCRLLGNAGLINEITLFTESGVIGGVPAPGVFFGVAVSPREIISSAETFRRCYEKLDMTMLGVLQADSQGNVNVSKRGERAINYVGPGGFIDLTTAAKTVCFVSSWMAHSQIDVSGSQLKVVKPGKPKFVEAVDEITFSGSEALKMGKKVFYVTHVGMFRLTERGMELAQVMPGIDIEKDILEFAPMRVVLPESGEVPVVDASIVTGKGFSMALEDRPEQGS